MITFFHTADAHFGIENYGKIDQKTGIHSRFLDFVQSFESLVDQAIARKIDFVLFCGDAYKTAYPTPTQQKQFLRLLYKLQQANIPVVIIVGNHDHPLSFGKTHSLDVFTTIPLKGIYVFAKPGAITIETKNGPIQIVGIPWPLRHNIITKQEHRFSEPEKIATHISEKVGMIIKNFAENLDSTIPAILAGHLTVSNGIFSGSEKCAIFGQDPCFLPTQLAMEPFDYVALGHLHRFQDLNKNGDIPIVYSGSIERIDFGERKENKGFCVVSIDQKKKWGKRCSYQFVELATRPMIQIEIILKEGKNQTQQLIKEIEQYEINGAIVKILYHIENGSSDKIDLLAVQRACTSAMCVASITPVRKNIVRERRVELSVTMDFETIVDRYLEGKSDSSIDAKKIKEKAIQMYSELRNNQEEDAEVMPKQENGVTQSTV